MYKNVISLPVYTKPEVIIDQILNIHCFNSDAAIVLHFNPIFSWESEYIDSIEAFASILDSLPYVYVNPERVRCGWADIIGAHMSNFKFMCTVCDFEYFTFAASNELYCRSGRDSLLVGQNALCFHRKIDVKKSIWKQAEGVDEDPYYKMIFPDDEDSKFIFCGYCEGTSYRRDIFEKIVEMVEDKYVHDDPKLFYAREEIYYPMALQKITLGADITHKKTTYIPWKTSMTVTCEDVCDIIDGLKDYYSVKRVDLDLFSPTRTFVRQYVGRYQDELSSLLKREIKCLTTNEIAEKNSILEGKRQRQLEMYYTSFENQGKRIWYFV